MKKLTKKDVIKIKKNYSKLSYGEKIEKYEALNNNTYYKCLSEEDFEQVFGYNFNQIVGYDEMTESSKQLIKHGILNLSNYGGMDHKADNLVYKIELDSKNNRFKLYHCTGYSWLYENGSIG